MEDLTTIVLACGAALGSAICFMHRIVMRQSKEIAQISIRIGRVEGENEGVKRFTESTLEAMKKALASRCVYDPQVNKEDVD